jgi:hypothetical protein
MKGLAYYVSLFIMLITISSCSTDSIPPVTTTGTVIIVNEGNFNHGNSSLSVYDPSRQVIQNDVYRHTNNTGMGDVAQSLTLIGDTGYAVINNSQKIVAMNVTNGFKYLYTITLLGASPRYMLPVSNTLAYVTDLYANRIWIVNYHTGAVIDTIAVNGWTERMFAYGGMVYVMQRSKPNGNNAPALLQINTATKQVNEYPLSAEPIDMDVSNDGKLYLLLLANSATSTPASLQVFDMASFTLNKVIAFPASRKPTLVKYSPANSKVILYDNAIYSFSPSAILPPDSPLINTNGLGNVYALACDPYNGNIYISDVLDYQQSSKVIRYSAKGGLIHSFNAGLITNGFVFR